jgi:hypothetical protein
VLRARLRSVRSGLRALLQAALPPVCSAALLQAGLRARLRSLRSGEVLRSGRQDLRSGLRTDLRALLQAALQAVQAPSSWLLCRRLR